MRHYSEAAYTNIISGGEATQEVLEAVIAADMIEFLSIKDFSGTPEQIITERVKCRLERMDKSLKIHEGAQRDPQSNEDETENVFDEFEIITDITQAISPEPSTQNYANIPDVPADVELDGNEDFN